METIKDEKKPGLNIKISNDNEGQVELLDNLQLTEDFKKNILFPYLKNLYEDLANRDPSNSNGIPQSTFLQFINMPGLFGDRIFHLYDTNKDGAVDIIEFVSVSGRFFQSTFESKLKLVFDIFDVNRDGFINGEDIKGILMHIPLDMIRNSSQTKEIAIPVSSSKAVYLDRVQSQEELGNLISFSMKDKPIICLEEFKELTSSVCSDMFLCVYLYLRSNFPLFDKVFLYANRIKRVSNVSSPHHTQVISSPKMLSKFSPLASMVKKWNSCRKLLPSPGDKGQKIKPSTPVRSTFTRETNDFSSFSKKVEQEEDFTSALDEEDVSDKPTAALHIPSLKVNSNDLHWLTEQQNSKDFSIEISGEAIRSSGHERKVSKFKTPLSLFINPENTSPVEDKKEQIQIDKSSSMLYCECGNVCDGDFTQCTKCRDKQEPVDFSGFLYTQLQEGIKEYWFRLLDKELYCFEKKDDTDYLRLYQLSGVFVKSENNEEIILEKIMFPFCLHINKNKRVFYASSDIEREKWIANIRKAIEYSNLFSFYDIKGFLGKGSFAEVRAAEHKISKQKSAVKILRKRQMTDKQIARARSEIETLRMCQHPNIMGLYEVYENADYIYLVLEYLSGGNLSTYLKSKKLYIPEKEACRYIHSIAHALDYMHTYGIIHRDIKLDNIVLSSQTEGEDVKIVDFGLAVILQPNELSNDPVGTLCYAAPEILLGMRYSLKVDMWSLGVLAYLLLSGSFPYSPELPEKEIAHLIIDKDVAFTAPSWEKRTSEAKDFVKKLLIRDPRFRMNTKEVFNHPWMLLQHSSAKKT